MSRLGVVGVGKQVHAGEEACGRLSPAVIETVRLSLVTGLTSAEIAAALGLPIGTVKTRLRRARAECRSLDPTHRRRGRV